MNYDVEILIVEDSPTQAELLRAVLRNSGYRVRVTTSGEEALVALQERVPALVITDIVMPGIDGYELCERIKSKQELADVPVILLTTLSEPQDVIRSLQCGADNFIRKPYDERYLLSRIGNILTSRELRDGGRMGVEVFLGGDRHFITAERQQILDFLLSTYEDIAQTKDELALRAAEVQAQNAQLEARQAELEQALRDLDAERQRFERLANINRAVLDATADGFALIDPAGKTLLWNAALTRIMAKLPVTASARSLSDYVEALAPLAADPERLRALAASLEADPDLEASFDLELPDAGLSLGLFVAPVREGSGSLLGRLFVVRDTTRERQADRLKSELVATVSHELRSPLTAVLGFADLLLTNRHLDEATRDRYARTIATEAERLTDLVDDFLDLHRIEEGHFAPTLEPLDLREVVRAQVDVFSGQSSAHSIALDLPPEPLPVAGDRSRLCQVLANLISNAIKYSPEGGLVAVVARMRDDLVEVQVRDHGMGIPAQSHEHIFRKFFRADSSDTRRIGGTGLGLALSREIVAAHGGEIGFESAEGSGSTFWFRLRAHRIDTAAGNGQPATESLHPA